MNNEQLIKNLRAIGSKPLAPVQTVGIMEDCLNAAMVIQDQDDVIEQRDKLFAVLDKLTDALFYYDEEWGYREEESKKTKDVLREYNNALETIQQMELIK